MLTTLLGVPESEVVVKGRTPLTLKQLTKRVYDDGRSQILHGAEYDRIKTHFSDLFESGERPLGIPSAYCAFCRGTRRVTDAAGVRAAMYAVARIGTDFRCTVTKEQSGLQSQAGSMTAMLGTKENDNRNERQSHSTSGQVGNRYRGIR